MTVVDVLAVALGSAAGGMARYSLVVAIESRRRDPRWPVGTLVVNLSGSLLLGLVVGGELFSGTGGARTAMIAALGSFTTVSAFVLESWQRRVHRATWIGYGLVTVSGCLLLFRLGLELA